jgi:hypothetical protein
MVAPHVSDSKAFDLAIVSTIVPNTIYCASSINARISNGLANQFHVGGSILCTWTSVRKVSFRRKTTAVYVVLNGILNILSFSRPTNM